MLSPRTFVKRPNYPRCRRQLMSDRMTQSRRSDPDIGWWKRSRSAAEIGEHLARFLGDKQDLEDRVAELLEENKELKLHCPGPSGELGDEWRSSKAEIGGLKCRSAGGLERLLGKSGNGASKDAEGTEGVMLKDELEKKAQALQVELDKERQLCVKLKEKIAGCICGGIRADNAPSSSSSSGLP